MEAMRENLLQTGALELGVNLGKNEVLLYVKYLDILLEWNKKINLTSITDPEEVVLKHFLDSIAAVPYLEKKESLRIMDIGTGAGFPGVPVKIACPEADMVLLDSLKKRITFLNHLIEELGLAGIKAIHGRAEDLCRQEGFREAFDVVTSRAVANLTVIAELCLPFVKVGGVFIAYKGPRAREEVEESKGALEILGGSLRKMITITLPKSRDERNLIFIAKEKETPEKYPRKAGIPEKRPLK